MTRKFRVNAKYTVPSDFGFLEQTKRTTELMYLPFVIYHIQIHTHTECAPKATHILETTESHLYPSPVSTVEDSDPIHIASMK